MVVMTLHQLLGILSVAIGLVSYAAYFHGIIKGGVRPHPFTWMIWGLLMLIGYAAAYVGGGGAGTWTLLITALLAFIVAGFGTRTKIARSDWAALIAALIAIPAWRMTSDPLIAVVIISAIDAIGIYPTFRKAYSKPQEESASAFSISTLQFAVSIFALEQKSLTTVLYPATIVTLNVLLVAMILLRRLKGRKPRRGGRKSAGA